MLKKVILPLLLSFYSYSTFANKGLNYDIVVYGASSAGVTASVQAAKMGKKVLLISQTKQIGGLTSSGLGATDINKHLAIGGLSREFYQRVYTYYEDSSSWKNENRKDYLKRLGKAFYGAWNDSLKMQWMFEPYIADKVFRDMLRDADVSILYNERIDLKKTLDKQGTRIQSIKMESGKKISAKIFIDCTYEGDLMAKAGVSYKVGRESNAVYNESFNGVRIGKLIGKDGVSVDPYLKRGEPDSGLLPFLEKDYRHNNGDGDHRLQAYCYRFTLTTDIENKLPIVKPQNYQPLWYEINARMFELDKGLTLDHVLTLTPLPNNKTDTNHADFIGANHAWPEANYVTREKLAKMHKDYVLGLLWFLANDKRVPVEVRAHMNQYGLPKDEFKENDNFPTEIYVREARRMISDYVMTEHNYFHKTKANDGVGLGTYWLDSHVVTRIVDEEGSVRDEGSFWENKSSTYSISYQSIRPKKEECTNLLVPVCLSASHAAYGSIRMEPVYMVLGQSAAIAATIAIDNDIAVQDVNYPVLKSKLHEYNQFLTPEDLLKN